MNTLLTDPQAASLILADENYEIQSTSTYLLARDEDCENSFHSTADFVSTPAYILFSSVLFCSVLHFSWPPFAILFLLSRCIISTLLSYNISLFFISIPFSFLIKWLCSYCISYYSLLFSFIVTLLDEYVLSHVCASTSTNWAAR